MVIVLGGLAASTAAAAEPADPVTSWVPSAGGVTWILTGVEPISGEGKPRADSAGPCDGVDKRWRDADLTVAVEMQARLCPAAEDAAHLVGNVTRNLPPVREQSVFGSDVDAAVAPPMQPGRVGCGLVRWWAQGRYAIGIAVQSVRPAPDECRVLNEQLARELAAALPGEPAPYTDVRAEIANALLTEIPRYLIGIFACIMILVESQRPRYRLPRTQAFTDVTRRARRVLWGARLWTLLRSVRLLARFGAVYQVVLLFVSGFAVLRLLAVVGLLLGSRLCTFLLRWIRSEPFMAAGGFTLTETILSGGFGWALAGGFVIRAVARLFAIALGAYYVLVAVTVAIGPHSWVIEASRARLAALPWSDFTLHDYFERALLAGADAGILGMIAALFGGLALAYFIDRLGLRVYALRAPDLLAEFKGDHILFLRNFGDDKITIGTASQLTQRSWLSEFNLFRRARFEEVVVQRLNDVGPVVALADPHIRLARLGSAKQVESHGTWRQTVLDLGSSARFIVMSAAPKNVNDGLLTEIGWLAGAFGHDQVMLVLPPARKRQLVKRWRGFLAAAMESNASFYAGLDTACGDGAAQVIVRFNGRWHGWGATTKTEASYVASLLEATTAALPVWAAQPGPLPLSDTVRHALSTLPSTQPVSTGRMLACGCRERCHHV